MVDSPSIVKRKNALMEKDIMYRGKSSLTSIIKTYEDFSREDITDTIRGMKSEASGSCSESCDAINDLFC
jgi:hypothetical protein